MLELCNKVSSNNKYITLNYQNKTAQEGSCIKQISIGLGHICALLPTKEVKCWGKNTDGQLGDGTYISKSIPTYVCNSAENCQEDRSKRLTGITQIVNGFHHTCALNETKEVYCWGENAYGNLGVGNTTKSNIPLKVNNLEDVITITSGWGANCAILSNNTSKCWGRNQWGALGNGTITNVLIPTFILNEDDNSNFENIKEIKTTGQSTYLKTTDNNVYFFGSNSYGKFGDSNYGAINYYYPQLVNHSFEQYSMYYHHTCSIDASNRTYCFGRNVFGQIGDGTTINTNIPLLVSGLNIQKISVGGVHSCGINSNEIYCWGDNTYGQLGNNTNTNSLFPLTVNINENIAELFTGYVNNCVVLNAGIVKCWGDNTYGQLGIDSTEVKLIPVEVNDALYN